MSNLHLRGCDLSGTICRSLAVTLLVAACFALAFCFPVTAAEVSGTDAGGPDGFRQALIPCWYLAEGTTYGGMETWVVVFNYNPTPVTVDLTFYTEDGKVDGPQDFPIPAESRQSFLLNSLVDNKKDVSTEVASSGGLVVCERVVYGPGKAWAHESMGSYFTGSTWNLAEGTTYGGMETWVVVLNYNPTPVTVDLTFYTEDGKVDGPQDFPIPAQSRQSFLLNSLVFNKKDVSTQVSASGGYVVCERSLYGPGKAWAHGSIGLPYTASNWFLAEGSTYGGMETWAVVFNPNPTPVTVDLTFYTEDGKVDGPQDFPILARSRQSFLLNSLVDNKKDVSTWVVASGPVICERSLYGPGKAWAHSSVASSNIGNTWFLAEGTTYGGMETWVVVMNPTTNPSTVDLTFYTEDGKVDGPQDFVIPARSRHSFLLNSLVLNKKDVSTQVTASGGTVVCERSVYGPGKAWAHASIGRVD